MNFSLVFVFITEITKAYVAIFTCEWLLLSVSSDVIVEFVDVQKRLIAFFVLTEIHQFGFPLVVAFKMRN